MKQNYQPNIFKIKHYILNMIYTYTNNGLRYHKERTQNIESIFINYKLHVFTLAHLQQEVVTGQISRDPQSLSL